MVGRITAQIDHAYNEFHGAKWGMFGFLELEDDQLADVLGETEHLQTHDTLPAGLGRRLAPVRAPAIGSRSPR